MARLHGGDPVLSALAYLPIFFGGATIGFFAAAFATRKSRENLVREADDLWRDLEAMTADRDQWRDIAIRARRNLQAFYRHTAAQ